MIIIGRETDILKPVNMFQTIINNANKNTIVQAIISKLRHIIKTSQSIDF